jgi:MYXO-CTERM domain-containing protein
MMIRSAMIVAGLVLSAGGVAHGAMLPPGTSFETTLGAAPGGPAISAGATLVASRTSPFASGTYTGNLVVQVFQNDTNNTLGGLTFVYTLTNDPSPVNDAINRLTITGWQGWLIDASYVTAAVGTVPFDIDRSNNGNVVGVDFQQNSNTVPLFPGNTGRPIVLRTNAPAVRDVIANVIDGSVTSVTTIGPNIPTPGAAALLGLGGLAVARRRRSR